MAKKPKQPRPRGRPPVKNPLSPAERMRRFRARRKEAAMSERRGMEAVQPTATYSSHRLNDARSLAMHVMAAEKIQRNPTLLAIPKRNLTRWLQRWGDSAPAWAHEWQRIMRQPWPEIAALITELSENATRLRQSTPFAGVLNPDERRRIYEAFRP